MRDEQHRNGQGPARHESSDAPKKRSLFAWVRVSTLVAGLAALGHHVPLEPHPEGPRGFRIAALQASESHGSPSKGGLFVSPRQKIEIDPSWSEEEILEAKRAAKRDRDRDRHCHTVTLGALYDTIARHANAYGVCHIGQKKLGKRAKIPCLRTLKRGLRRLAKLGLVVRIGRSASGQWNDDLNEPRSTIYWVQLSPLSPEAIASLDEALEHVRALSTEDFLAEGADLEDEEAAPSSSAAAPSPPSSSAAAPSPPSSSAAAPSPPSSSAAAPSPLEMVRRALVPLDALTRLAWSEGAQHWLGAGLNAIDDQGKAAPKNAAQIAASIGDVIGKVSASQLVGVMIAAEEIASMLQRYISREKRELKDPFARKAPPPKISLLPRERDRLLARYREGEVAPEEIASLASTLHPTEIERLVAAGVVFPTGPPNTS
jgi:hypothetical protein